MRVSSTRLFPADSSDAFFVSWGFLTSTCVLSHYSM